MTRLVKEESSSSADIFEGATNSKFTRVTSIYVVSFLTQESAAASPRPARVTENQHPAKKTKGAEGADFL